ncbi:MAG: ABC transporter substrate-binding protein [Hyphomicrobiales bacterium]|nr:ABC transporter substrate-binding protein [Hyphomicrobiales bacterium]MDE2113651.1 ABC transporter substrate-binding protein [Hyphomicrobiales bacterium]
MVTRRELLEYASLSAVAAGAGLAARPLAFGADMPGVTATEIKIGQTMAYSGPASAYGVVGRVEAAYFKMINEQGGINGRKINLISLDDGYSPPKAVEQVRRLVEQDNVAFIFQSLGTPSNVAIRPYLNAHKVPQLFSATGASLLGDPKHFPWTMGVNPTYRTEGAIYGKHILATKPDAKIAVLYQNDDLGRDYLSGLKDGLGEKNLGMIVKEVSYEVSEPTIDSQVVTLQGSGADVFLIAATPKFGAQAVRKSFDLGWKAVRYIVNVTASFTILKAAGLEKSHDLITASYAKDPTDKIWSNDEGVKQWTAFCQKYMSASVIPDANAVYAYGVAQVLMQVLKQCGNDLSRENVMKQATSLKDVPVSVFLPGITVSTSPDNYYPIRKMQLQRFDGENWKLFGDLISG